MWIIINNQCTHLGPRHLDSPTPGPYSLAAQEPGADQPLVRLAGGRKVGHQSDCDSDYNRSDCDFVIMK